MRNQGRRWCACSLLILCTAPLAAQTPTPANSASAAATNSTMATPAPAVVQPPDYVIGPDDVLSIGFWRDKELSADVFVRPDGKISLPLLNDIQAAGLTPEQLRATVTEAAARVMEDPTVMVMVKQINSRKVYVVGQVSKPGPYALPGPMSVVQLLALAGGLLEYADRENILVIRAARQADGTPISQRVNYTDLMKGKKLQQNFELKPGDTVMVP
jgi:polysaccharide export outer membrane protein